MTDGGRHGDAGLSRFVGVLEEARDLGLIGPGPVERQYHHAAAVASMLAPFEGRFLDLGSGAGLPGLVVAYELPGSSGVLLDAQHRRCEFLRRSVERLALGGRVEVACGRAEVLAREPNLRAAFDVVVARSFGPPAVTAECAVAFLRAGGSLVVTEPPADAADIGERWPESGMARLGFSRPEALRRNDAGAMRAALLADADPRWPRREGMPAKRPLW